MTFPHSSNECIDKAFSVGRSVGRQCIIIHSSRLHILFCFASISSIEFTSFCSHQLLPPTTPVCTSHNCASNCRHNPDLGQVTDKAKANSLSLPTPKCSHTMSIPLFQEEPHKIGSPISLPACQICSRTYNTNKQLANNH